MTIVPEKSRSTPLAQDMPDEPLLHQPLTRPAAALSEETLNADRRNGLIALSAATFVDRGEEMAMSALWPFMYRSLGASVGQLGIVLGLSQIIATLTLPVWGYMGTREHFVITRKVAIFTFF